MPGDRMDKSRVTGEEDFGEEEVVWKKKTKINVKDVNVEELGERKGTNGSTTRVANRYRMEALKFQANCHFYKDNLEKCLEYLQQWELLAPRSSECREFYEHVKNLKNMRDQGAQFFEASKFVEAQSVFQDLIVTVRSGNFSNTCIESKMQFNLGLIHYKLQNYNRAFIHASNAIRINRIYLKAYRLRGNCFSALGKYREAITEYETALKIDPSCEGLKKHIQTLQLKTKKVERQDFYTILQVGKYATKEEIRRAYKKCAMMHHPDRHANATEEVRKDEEEHFKIIGAAYETLTDEKKRSRYDNALRHMFPQ